MPGFGVLVESGAIDGALEVLETDLALDGLGSGILQRVSDRKRWKCCMRKRTDFS